VTCTPPSSRVNVAMAAVTPEPALTVSPAPSVNGGQFAAQSPLQVLLLAESVASR